MKEASFIHYDIEKDSEGLYRWLADSEKFFNAPQIIESEDTLEAITNTVQSIINHFQNLIENQDLWRIFFTKDNEHVVPRSRSNGFLQSSRPIPQLRGYT